MRAIREVYKPLEALKAQYSRRCDYLLYMTSGQIKREATIRMILLTVFALFIGCALVPFLMPAGAL